MIHMNTTDINDALEKLGFTKDSIVETIFVTRNRDGSFNATPIGVIRHGESLEVRLYKSSNTYRNLLNTTKVSINITDDSMLFLLTAFKVELSGTPTVTDWILEGSDATIIAEKTGVSEFSDLQALFTLKPITFIVNREMPTVFSRGRAEAIEAIIHATRVKVYQHEYDEAKVQELVEKMRESFKIINRVSSPASSEGKVVEKLVSLLENWGVKQ